MYDARIYIVEPDDKVREMLQKFLSENFRDIKVFSAPEEVLPLRGLLPQAIVSEEDFPNGMNGEEFLKAIRARSRTLPVIFISYRVRNEYLDINVTHEDYMQKPFDVEELLLRVRAHIESARHRRCREATLYIVEPDDNIREMLQRFFTDKLGVVKTFSSPEEVLPLIEDELPHVIVTEETFPNGMSGNDFLRIIRTTPHTTHIGVIFMLQRAYRSDRVGYHPPIEELADDDITKPFDVEELLLRIKNSFEVTESIRRRDSE